MSTSVEQTPRGTVVADEEEVEGSRPGARWSVRECDWRDELPADVVDLLAPPVIVSAEAFAPAGGRTATPDSDVSADPPPVAPDGAAPAAYRPRHAAQEEAPVRFAVPPRRLRRRRSAAA